MKLGRIYRLEVKSTTGTVSVSYPLTLEFEVSRNTLSSANTGSFDIYNLKEDTRAKIFHDRYDNAKLSSLRRVTLYAGYEGEPKLPIIFDGNATWAYSYRKGPNWITHIDAFDAGWSMANSQVSTTFPSGYSFSQIFTELIKSMKEVSMGAISDLQMENSRGVTLSGNSWDTATRMMQGKGFAFVDNGKANALKYNDALNGRGQIRVINSSSGLLNTPRKAAATITLEMLFEPQVIVGQLVKVDLLAAINNGTYQVQGVKHRGTISGAVSGDARTYLSLWSGTGPFVEIF